tara:strand:- start:1118 stop:1957 length:840 start_codon:yes stop_codon:yes gene_type:complete
MKSLSFTFLPLIPALLFTGCQPEQQDPNKAIDGLVKDFGYIGFQNPLENTRTGSLIGGRPDAVSFVAPPGDCYPDSELPRYTDRSEYSRIYKYKFQGSLGFLLSGNFLLSAGLSLKKDITVEIELSGLTTEYMSSIDITDWYLEGMSETCRLYLNDVGFIIQALKAEKLSISFKKISGNSIGINADNVSEFVQFETGVDWNIEDETKIVITTPKYVGYQLGRLRLEDDGRSLWRAMSVKDDKYFFERIALFDDVKLASDFAAPVVRKSMMTDRNAVYAE